MARFTPPASITKVASGPAGTGMWPIGHLFYHAAADTYFRFISSGASRGNPSYGISTSKGIFVATGYGPSLKYFFVDTIHGYNVVTHSDKNALVARLLTFLNNA